MIYAITILATLAAYALISWEVRRFKGQVREEIRTLEFVVAMRAAKEAPAPVPAVESTGLVPLPVPREVNAKEVRDS